MEDEGLEVFFEDSPSALYVDPSARQELVIRDEDNQGEEEPTIETHPHVGVARRIWAWLLEFFLGPLHETSCLAKMTLELGDSPLLTDEDHHLLHSVQDSQPSLNHTHNHTHVPSFLSLHLANWKFWSAMIILLSIWLSWISFMDIPYGMFVTLCEASVLLFPAIWRQFLVWWVGLQVQRAQHDRDDYYRSFDLLLNQLSSSLRWLQEVEVIGQGFARPFPSSKLLHQMGGTDHAYKHAQLRESLLSVSSRMVNILRASTRELHKTVVPLTSGCGWLGVELRDKRKYLAFTSLSQLHPHLTLPLEGEEQIYEPNALQLDSLKDAGSLVGVLNSQLLRSLCLAATLACRDAVAMENVGMATRGVKMVRLLSACLGEIVVEVKLATQELASSLTFNKNMLLEPPSVPNTTGSKLTSDLQGVLDQVHCLDLKTHCLLHRVRSLKDRIQEVDVALPDLTVEVECVGVYVRGVADSADVLSSMMQHSDTEGDAEEEELSPGAPVSMETELSVAVATGDQAEYDSSESECFVCDGRLTSDEETMGGEEEEGEQVPDKCEVPLGMMRELQSVLTLRQEEKDRRRQQKRRKRHKNGRSDRELDAGQDQNGTSDTEHAQTEVVDTEHVPNAVLSTEHAQSTANQISVQDVRTVVNHGGVASDHGDDGTTGSPGDGGVASNHGGGGVAGNPGNEGIADQTVKFSPFTPHSLSEQLKAAIIKRRNVTQEDTFS